MSRRLRNRLDKRDTALELARLCGHGEEMPGEEEEQEPIFVTLPHRVGDERTTSEEQHARTEAPSH